jgi:hypothetical protein
MRALPTRPAVAEHGILFAAAAPGGAARQFRVQVSTPGAEPRWRLYGSFREATAAQSCIDALRSSGAAARLVVYQTLPCAA